MTAKTEEMMLLTPNWRDWYYFRHQQACFESGAAFESYVSKVLDHFHDDFLNPAPAGTLRRRRLRWASRVWHNFLCLLWAKARPQC